MPPKREDSQLSQDSVMTVTQEDRHEILYFAYGSNLSTVQMRQRCPYSTPIGIGHLDGWKWLINERGYANVVKVSGSEAKSSEGSLGDKGKGKEWGVYGLLYLLPPDDEAKLDTYEGVPWAYEKMTCDARWVRDGQGKVLDEPVKTLVYVDTKRVGESVPKEEYVERMERGIEDAVDNWGLDREYATKVMRRFWK
ncbi:AIG2 family protein [Pochonia chlamydosporia 170]|uniref:gamma-glutamylcyclotransferase n=1 Tax=Pochonia chlamydosporia 170 TaxID=1380566 RepID=A0A179FSY4_METCM|nr:AIG2 family protein [Pochonia chlamydosporia 170]OAQ68129.1 AIG2 family protein [Pochonia chlamydosporia 170]